MKGSYNNSWSPSGSDAGTIVELRFSENSKTVLEKQDGPRFDDSNSNIYMAKLQYKPDLISLSEINGLYFRDKGSFTINDKIKNKVLFDTKKIKDDSYKESRLADMIDKMNTEDPI